MNQENKNGTDLATDKKAGDDNNMYDPEKLIEVLMQRTGPRGMPMCPICGNKSYTTPDDAVMVSAGKNIKTISLGRAVPCAMVICEKCGHISLFSLGILGLMPKKEVCHG